MTDRAKKLGNERIVYTRGHELGGLTKRELFAAMAMQGLIAAQTYSVADVSLSARHSINSADALLEELSKNDKTE